MCERLSLVRATVDMAVDRCCVLIPDPYMTTYKRMRCARSILKLVYSHHESAKNSGSKHR